MTTLDEIEKTLTIDHQATLERDRVAIEVVSGPDAGVRHEFVGQLRIGSRGLAALVLHDPKVSGLHCEISAAGHLRVHDLGSKNGTWVSGLRIFDVIVPAGQTISLGDTQIKCTPVGARVQLPLHDQDRFFGIIGRSPAMRALNDQVKKLATSDSTVLVQGETGSGKELIAEALHLAGRRAAHPLTIVDCGSLPAGLIESELFGHVRGAFTGATSDVTGAFERAHGGTLFLDEIGELPLELQPKLLRALESREVRRLGSPRSSKFDVRIVAATHRDLASEVNAGRFREDLYYRIAVITLMVPPLRDRIEDLPLLAIHLLTEMGHDPHALLSAESLSALSAHDWPGNVRELRNTLERAAALMEPALPLSSPSPRDTTAEVNLRVPLPELKRRTIERVERLYIEKLLAECAGNISEVARRAGMDRMSIHRIVQRLDLRRGG